MVRDITVKILLADKITEPVCKAMWTYLSYRDRARLLSKINSSWLGNLHWDNVRDDIIENSLEFSKAYNEIIKENKHGTI